MNERQKSTLNDTHCNISQGNIDTHGIGARFKRSCPQRRYPTVGKSATRKELERVYHEVFHIRPWKCGEGEMELHHNSWKENEFGAGAIS